MTQLLVNPVSVISTFPKLPELHHPSHLCRSAPGDPHLDVGHVAGSLSSQSPPELVVPLFGRWQQGQQQQQQPMSSAPPPPPTSSSSSSSPTFASTTSPSSGVIPQGTMVPLTTASFPSPRKWCKILFWGMMNGVSTSLLSKQWRPACSTRCRCHLHTCSSSNRDSFMQLCRMVPHSLCCR